MREKKPKMNPTTKENPSRFRIADMIIPNSKKRTTIKLL